jgi:predicted DNA-binding ribbon-helix-helix protein
VIGSHKTSVSMEPEFMAELRRIALARRVPLSRLIGEVDGNRTAINLSSALRVYVLNHVRSRIRAGQS